MTGWLRTLGHRVTGLCLGAGLATWGCRDPGDAPAIPDPRPGLTTDGGAGPADPADARRLGGPPGSGGIPAALDPRTTSCPDPVVGVWVAKTFADSALRWHEHRLSIARDGDDELHAQQTTRIWQGDASAGLPPVCPEGGPSWGVYRMTDKARFVDGILHVWGLAVDASAHTCGGEVLAYNLDSFTGRVGPNVYAARNNDGSQAVNRPYRFRRIACAPD